MNKYGARKISLGGMTFDSEREFNRWGDFPSFSEAGRSRISSGRKASC